MAIGVETKDCVAVEQGELDAMAALCATSPFAFDVKLLAKQCREWVLISIAKEFGSIAGFSYFTLERIGGTPCVLIGAGHVCPGNNSEALLQAMLKDKLHRAVMSFPDEDVLIGARINNAGGYRLYDSLNDTIPRPNHRASGEERAWGRRLAKRFGVPPMRYQDRAFTVNGDGRPAVMLDHMGGHDSEASSGVSEHFANLDTAAGDTLIVFGWAMTEDLEKLR